MRDVDRAQCNVALIRNVVKRQNDFFQRCVVPTVSVGAEARLCEGATRCLSSAMDLMDELYRILEARK